MTRKGVAEQLKFKFKGFENVDFTDAERADVVSWIKKTKLDPLDCATVLVEAGYKVGLGYDDYNGVTVVSLTCKNLASKYFGYCFMFKHADLGKGLLIARYIHDTSLAAEHYELGAKSNLYDW